MSKFKVGDWVKCTDPTSYYYGTVAYLDDEDEQDDAFWCQFEGKGRPSMWMTLDEDMWVLTPAPGVKTKPKTEGVKYDSNKRQWWFMWQFLPELEQVVDILDYGNKKYPADDGSNWRKVDNAKNRYTSAAMRHWSAWLGGEKVDAETGKSHLAHMITNLLFLMWFERKAND